MDNAEVTSQLPADDARATVRKAVSCRGLPEIKALLRREAAIKEYALEHPGETGSILDLALHYQRPEVAQCLIKFYGERGRLPELIQASRRALVWCARDGRADLVGTLLRHGMDVTQRDWHERTPLHAAFLRGHRECAQMLLRLGAWDAEPDKDDVCKWAIHWHLEPLLKALGVVPGAGQLDDTSAGATRKQRLHGTGLTPDQIAHAELATPLRAHGAQPQGTDRRLYATGGVNGNNTAREIADSPKEDPEITRRCVQPRAEHLAQSEATQEHLELLRAELCHAIQKGDVKHAASAVKRGAPLNEQYDLGYGELGNCIDWACVAESPAVALKLLELADDRGVGGVLAAGSKSALCWSVIRGYTEVVLQLLKHGADPGQRNATWPAGETALSLAVSGWREEEVAALLIFGAWNHEPQDTRPALLRSAMLRGPVAQAFRKAGVGIEDGSVQPPVHPQDCGMVAVRGKQVRQWEPSQNFCLGVDGKCPRAAALDDNAAAPLPVN